jgi:uncharacterized membrane protein
MAIDTVLEQIRGLVPKSTKTAPFLNVNAMHEESMTLGQRIADGVARNMGSWRFIIIQSGLLIMWVAANIAFAVHELTLFGLNIKAWDIYPFILLNLALSFQAAYAAPIIMMSQNRQADKDRLAAEHDYHVNIRSEATVRAVLEHLKAQDDVILTILDGLQRIHGMAPDAAQQAAEARLGDVSRVEDEILRSTVAEEEREAGLEPA